MPESSTDESQAQKVRNYLVNRVESENLNIRDRTVRRNLIDTFKKENPTIKKTAVESRFAREFRIYARATGISESDLAGAKKKVSSKLIDPISQPQPVSGTVAQPMQVQNPYVNPAANPQAFQQPQVNPFGVNNSQVEAFSRSVFSVFTAAYPDMEDLSKEESQDLGDLLTPIATRHINGEKTHAVFAVGGVAGIMARKIKAARIKKREREAKESKSGNTEKIIEDTTQKTPPPPPQEKPADAKKIGKKEEIDSSLEG